MREKLIQILRVPIFPHELADPTEAVADYLLDNDVVPVVRCKDCRSINRGVVRPEGRYLCERISRWVFPDDFCSCGERRNNSVQE